MTPQETYSVTLTYKQRVVISGSIEFAQKLMLGKWKEIFEFLPLSQRGNEISEEDMERIDEVLSEYLCFMSKDALSHYHECSDLYKIIHSDTPLTLDHVTFKLTRGQLGVISNVADLAQRVQLGQWREIESFLPLCSHMDFKDLNEIGYILSKYTVSGVNGWGSSLGVGHKDLPESNSILYDIRCAIRHKLSWEEAVEKGYVESESSPRNWREMMTVNYDEPMHYGSEPLLKLERCFPEG